MYYIKGKFKQSIFKSDSGYNVGLFKISETDDPEMETFLKKTVTFTGYFSELNPDDTYILYGSLIYHDRYGYQYSVASYEKCMPTGRDAVVEFLTSSLIKGCGEKTAIKIVDILGDNAIEKIKENINNLDLISGISDTKKKSIYNSILKYYESNETIIKLKEYGFSIKESMKLINVYGNGILNIVINNIYSLIDLIDFKTLDKIYLNIYKETTNLRILACIVETMKRITFNSGDTYSYKDEIIVSLRDEFNIIIDSDDYFSMLSNENRIVIKDDKYYLKEYYDSEKNIVKRLYEINNVKVVSKKNVNNYIEALEKEFHIKYNDEQKEAISSIIDNNLIVITGGPGTGKTTIVNGILNLYKLVNKLSDDGLNNKVALIAPTGRASKRMSETTNFGASTIHRYLKWNKETDTFGINEYNKTYHELVIVDETSMIDTMLFDTLLKGLRKDVKLVLVGDEAQLPSVSPGLILNDIISSNKFKHIRLTNIYRQSKNSYIPILASEIKSKNLTDYLDKKDDYNFIECNSRDIKSLVVNIANKSLDKGYSDNNIQILAPMYKGEIGIDNLNINLQSIFNPHDDNLSEVVIGSVTYRINDKVLNLVNDVDKGIYNGDIGYVYDIDINSKSDFIRVNFDNNIVSFKRDEMSSIKHAYAISIHKAQGSEFDHVIMPISKSYNKMLYNKLIYTGISRAKKSLIIIGSKEAFLYSVNNDYSNTRKTTLLELLVNKK
ncbi:MAG: ATP-dependent RecD-like DNA helicase [Bacilli bacterium]|nr:ATP-dependent RecD-like DNA helicase [Bacilli bacterium]